MTTGDSADKTGIRLKSPSTHNMLLLVLELLGVYHKIGCDSFVWSLFGLRMWYGLVKSYFKQISSKQKRLLQKFRSSVPFNEVTTLSIQHSSPCCTVIKTNSIQESALAGLISAHVALICNLLCCRPLWVISVCLMQMEKCVFHHLIVR